MDNHLKKHFNRGADAFSEYLNRYKTIFADVRDENTNERTKYFMYGRNFVFITYRNGEVVTYGDVSNPDIELEFLKRKGAI